VLAKSSFHLGFHRMGGGLPKMLQTATAANGEILRERAQHLSHRCKAPRLRLAPARDKPRRYGNAKLAQNRWSVISVCAVGCKSQSVAQIVECRGCTVDVGQSR